MKMAISIEALLKKRKIQIQPTKQDLIDILMSEIRDLAAYELQKGNREFAQLERAWDDRVERQDLAAKERARRALGVMRGHIEKVLGPDFTVTHRSAWQSKGIRFRSSDKEDFVEMTLDAKIHARVLAALRKSADEAAELREERDAAFKSWREATEKSRSLLTSLLASKRSQAVSAMRLALHYTDSGRKLLDALDNESSKAVAAILTKT